MESDLNFRLACPMCGAELETISADARRCQQDNHVYARVEGIWQFLTPQGESKFQQFMREYPIVRRGEQRGSSNPAYFQALPFEDLSGKMSADWRIRAGSFQALLQHVIEPLEESAQPCLQILDLGSGNGWLAYRLADRGHHLAAVDLLTNAFDGLGAHVHYPVKFICLQAEFDHLPLSAWQVDVAIFNSSIHYTEDYRATLQEGLRVLKPGGKLVIMDSPIYTHASSGQRMVQERQRAFLAQYGFPSDALASQNFFTHEQLTSLADELGIAWHKFTPHYGFRWWLRPWKARLLNTREPAQFMLLVADAPG